MRLLYFFILGLISYLSSAQKITNVNYELSNNQVEINYDLDGEGLFNVGLYFSGNEGKTWTGPVSQVTGDIGSNQNVGKGKLIIWHVTADSAELQSLQLKVKAIKKENTVLDMNYEINTSGRWIFVKGGSFIMGNTNGNKDERPEYKVEFESFYINKYEVTVEEYINFLNTIGCSGNGRYKDEVYGYVSYVEMSVLHCPIDYSDEKFKFKKTEIHPTVNCPVTCVTWFGANAYCRFRNGRLPRESEWEYVAKSGNQNLSLPKIAWFRENSEKRMHAVGRLLPNRIGIYDIYGNAWEWCSNGYHKKSYKNKIRNRTDKNRLSSTKVVRGGGFKSDLKYLKAYKRGRYNPSAGDKTIGFRVARSLK